ncbi:MAG: PleD family two-component system response regulator [Bdellovibrionales bacterium]
MEKHTVMIVEDESELREMLAEKFVEENLNVRQAADGRRALASLKEDPLTHVILCDISMPAMTGLELVRELRNAGLGHIPVVMLTAHSETQRLKEALRLGAFDYVVKPFDLKPLVDTVFQAIEVGVRQWALIQDLEREGHIDRKKWVQSNRTIDLLKLRNNASRLRSEE